MNEKDFKADSVHVTVCSMGADCAAATRKLGHELGAQAIYQCIKDKRTGMDLKGKVLVQQTSCQGWCDYAPVITLWPSGKVYRGIKPAEAEKFIEEAVVKDSGHFKDRKIWDFGKSVEDNHDERNANGIKNPAQSK